MNSSIESKFFIGKISKKSSANLSLTVYLVISSAFEIKIEKSSRVVDKAENLWGMKTNEYRRGKSSQSRSVEKRKERRKLL
jgi:hypothetical protein